MQEAAEIATLAVECMSGVAQFRVPLNSKGERHGPYQAALTLGEP